MDAVALQRTLDVAFVGHLDGQGRSVVWRTPGLRDGAAAIRQGAVVPGTFDTEPGWMLRHLPDGRWAFYVGGTRHPDLDDSFGRSGIFHGVVVVGSARSIGTALQAEDARTMAMQVAKAAMRGAGISAQLRALERTIDVPVVASQDAPAPDWPTARAILCRGLFACAGPIGGRLVADAPRLSAGALDALRLDVGEAAAKRILAAWS